ncbi:MAG: PQQ-binding-like beta-propeller repeat protein, partial [Dokdonella sp.]
MKWLRIAGLLSLSVFALAGAAGAQSLQRVDAGGGAIAPPVTQGDHLYVGTGSTVSVWNMADPTQPVYAGRTNQAPAAGVIGGVAVVNGYLYVAWYTPAETGGITIYSLDDPAHPTAVAEFDDYVESDYKRPLALATSGNYVFVGDNDNGLVVLDASDPMQPSFVTANIDVSAFDNMAAFGSQLLVFGNGFIGRSVSVVDISDPTVPTVAGSTDVDFVFLRAVLTDGYAIGVGTDLGVYDLTDPSNITEVFDTPIDIATQAIRSGDTLYLIGDSGIQVWDFSTPAAPGLLRTVAIGDGDAFAPDQAADMPFGPLILTHTDRGIVLDVADAQNPTLASEFSLPVGVSVHAGAIGTDYAYFAEEGYGIGVADAPTLATLGRYDADLPADLAARDMEDISVDGGRAYLAAWGYGVLIADLSDPAHPSALGGFEFPFASAIEAHGDRVYVSSTTNGGFFKILDVSDPANPHLLGSLATSQTYDLTVRGDYAYLVDGADFADGGLRVVDVSNAATPIVTGQDLGCPYASGVDVSADGGTTYIACSSGELRIVDTTDKTNPVALGSVMLPSSPSLPDYNVAHSVVVVGNLA